MNEKRRSDEKKICGRKIRKGQNYTGDKVSRDVRH